MCIRDRFSADSKLLATGSLDKVARIYGLGDDGMADYRYALGFSDVS